MAVSSQRGVRRHSYLRCRCMMRVRRAADFLWRGCGRARAGLDGAGPLRSHAAARGHGASAARRGAPWATRNRDGMTVLDVAYCAASASGRPPPPAADASDNDVLPRQHSKSKKKKTARPHGAPGQRERQRRRPPTAVEAVESLTATNFVRRRRSRPSALRSQRRFKSFPRSIHLSQLKLVTYNNTGPNRAFLDPCFAVGTSVSAVVGVQRTAEDGVVVPRGRPVAGARRHAAVVQRVRVRRPLAQGRGRRAAAEIGRASCRERVFGRV